MVGVKEQPLTRLGSKLCRDEIQSVRGGQIKRIADQRRRRIERRIHLDLPQQLLSPSGTKNGHAPCNVPNVKPFAGQQEASPNLFVRLVLPDVGAGRRVQTMNRSAQAPNVKKTSFRNGLSPTPPVARKAQRSLLSVTSPWPLGLIA